MTDKKQNEVSESKEIPHEINSISDLSQILQTLGEPEKGHTRFFRGHGDKDWQMLPSIYREDYLIENEDKIISSPSLSWCCSFQAAKYKATSAFVVKSSKRVLYP